MPSAGTPPPVVPPVPPPTGRQQAGLPSWPPQPPYATPRPRRRSIWGRLFILLGVLVLLGSVVLNIVLVAMVSLPFISRGGLQTAVIQEGAPNQVVALLEIDGMIGDDKAQLVRSFCRQVSGDRRVKAVLLRVESPGGGVSACDRIYKQLKDLKRETGKKIVVSMGGVAASGGYYVSAPADAILAEPTTVTGSIGVLGGWVVLKGTMDKIGAKLVIVRSSKTRAWKAAPSSFEEPADYQIAELQKTIDEMHDRFEKIVRDERGKKLKITTADRTYVGADGKPFTVENESEPFNGKIFLAERAQKLGLVDEVGYLEDAIEEAGSLAGLTRPRVVVYARRRTLRQELGLGQAKPFDAKILDELQTPRIMYLWKVDQ